ncbi:hypothetical protein PAXRUDRAFT_16843 [Paxillus rubicundulus Ve08.2h10]|uniref:Uncharacterized protein n=1 Tax=Paxillus rubicundulus Ve08.2h10 TaxID=930991 RepID=A0A0D0CT10_9AGAM|nr:hypothetical protein PAXRUDRAFT_16843 [Paxillus rubicundulus Ve08.2h10]
MTSLSPSTPPRLLFAMVLTMSASSDIDAILQLFYPNMLLSDSLTGGQFFATLRLVVHAESGKGVELLTELSHSFRVLSLYTPMMMPPHFVRPPPTNNYSSRCLNHVPRPSSPPKKSVQAPPSRPDRPKPSTSNALSQESNPFTRRSVEQPVPQPCVLLELPPVIPQRHSQKISHNPFLMHDKADRGELAEKSSDKVVGTPCVAKNGKLPPLPPRKPALSVAPRASEAVPSTMTSTANFMSPFGPSLIATKPAHMISQLMQQSLEASKQGQSIKRAEEQLDRERVLQVLKTTTSGLSGSNQTRSLSPSKHIYKSPSDSRSEGATSVLPLPPRRKPSPPSSMSSSIPTTPAQSRLWS